jgi:hypothetical protein
MSVEAVADVPRLVINRHIVPGEKFYHAAPQSNTDVIA